MLRIALTTETDGDVERFNEDADVFCASDALMTDINRSNKRLYNAFAKESRA